MIANWPVSVSILFMSQQSIDLAIAQAVNGRFLEVNEVLGNILVIWCISIPRYICH